MSSKQSESAKKFWASDAGQKKRQQVREMGKNNTGKKASSELKAKFSLLSKQRGARPPIQKGENNVNWKGGVTSEHQRIRG